MADNQRARNEMNSVRPCYLSAYLCALAILIAGCDAPASSAQIPGEEVTSEAAAGERGTNPAGTSGSSALATFAGGCFWCMEPPYDKLPGVISTTSGYTGGHASNPDYQQVTAGGTGHYESVQIVYDPTLITYEKLIDVFWLNVDPLDAGGQFCDRGQSYRTAIFYHDESQRDVALSSKAAVADRLADVIATRIVEATQFYPAEDYHQDYYQKNPLRYAYYRRGCGRDARLNRIWGSADH